MFLASENIDFTGLAHVFLLGGGECCPRFFVSAKEMRRGEEGKCGGKEQNKGEKANCYTGEEALCPHADTLRRGTPPACTALCPLTAFRLSRTPCAQSAKQPGGGRGREKRENWSCRRRFGAAWPCLGGAFSLKAPFDPKAPSLWKAPVWAACCSKGAF